MAKEYFRNTLGNNVFRNKYAQGPNDTWPNLAERLVEDVCGTRWGTCQPLMSTDDRKRLTQYITDMYFIPGGRYLYYAGREAKFYNNCFLLRAEEDSREEWANLAWRATSCLMVGGGIGIDYSRLRHEGAALKRTGGVASGPIPLMRMINEIGRNVMQGGSRRSAIYASLDREHPDVEKFLVAKNWEPHIKERKEIDFNAHAPLDMTNISVNYSDDWLDTMRRWEDPVFMKNVHQAMMTGEPGFSFNFREKKHETLRNACTEVTSADDSDVCNLGSVNMGRIESIDTFKDVVSLASKFLVCGTVRAQLPYEKVQWVRNKNRRLGLGLMGIHEWLLKRGFGYEMNAILKQWLEVYKTESEVSANEHCDRFYLSHPVGYRAIAPTGTIGILAGTTTGIEPVYTVAYRRRYLTDGTKWRSEFVVDSTAELLIEEGINPDSIETAMSLAANPGKRIAFQAEVQKYVDHAISSTLNLPAWGSEFNNEKLVYDMASTIADYAPMLRGLTFYPDGSRGGQPITAIPYEDAIKHKGVVFEDNSDRACKEGVCGV